jgi:cytochrome c2
MIKQRQPSLIHILFNLLYSYNILKMKSSNLNIVSVISFIVLFVIFGVNMIACKPSQKVAAKSGVQLWAENCQRCHNTPSPSTFSHEQWEKIGLHMQTRALITDQEREKIVAFLKQ